MPLKDLLFYTEFAADFSVNDTLNVNGDLSLKVWRVVTTTLSFKS